MRKRVNRLPGEDDRAFLLRKLAIHSEPWDIPPSTHNYVLETPCRRWTGVLHHQTRYGQVADVNGVMRQAHRIALALFLGREITEGLDVAHKCDRRACIEPTHLYEATRQENIMDKAPEVRERAGGLPGNVGGRSSGGKLRGGTLAKADGDLSPGVFRNPQKPGRFLVQIRHYLLGTKKIYFGIFDTKEAANAVATAVYAALAAGDVPGALKIKAERAVRK